MSNPLVHNWEIDKIQATEWLGNGSVASAWASNWAGDSLAFDLSWHPDGFSVVYNIEIGFFSEELLPYLGEDIINDSILGTVEKRLSDWWSQVQYMKQFLSPSEWNVSRGLPVPDIQYAALAHLYSLRAEMSPLNVTQLLSEDMSVPLSTTKERLRKARLKEFLTSPGKGLNGQGEVTKKAINLFKKASY